MLPLVLTLLRFGKAPLYVGKYEATFELPYDPPPEIALVVMDTMRPVASTRILGIAVSLPYAPAPTPVNAVIKAALPLM